MGVGGLLQHKVRVIVTVADLRVDTVTSETDPIGNLRMGTVPRSDHKGPKDNVKGDLWTQPVTHDDVRVVVSIYGWIRYITPTLLPVKLFRSKTS